MTTLTRILAGSLVSVAVLGLGGCGSDEVSGPETGSLEVLLSMEGTDQDRNGGTLLLNGEPLGQLAVGVKRRDVVASGIHVISVTGIASNCSPLSAIERNVTVRTGGLASVEFRFLCESTSGKDPGGDPAE